MASIQPPRDEVDRRVRDLKRSVERAGTAQQAEETVWTGLLAVGQLLMVTFFEAQARRWEPGTRYSHDGRRYGGRRR